MTLKENFEQLGIEVWEKIKLADKYNVNYGEETITDQLLLDLAAKNHYGLKIIQTTKPREAIQGTDWEWYIGSDSYGWMHFALQAKKLNSKKGSYSTLNRKIGTSAKPQIQALREYADSNNKIIPLYTFYNHCHNASINDWRCSQPFNRELLGWTFSPLNQIETIVGKRSKNTFNAIHQMKYTLPIRCLFSCRYFRNKIYEIETLTEAGNFLGETFYKIKELPAFLRVAAERGTLNYNEIEFTDSENIDFRLYPKHIAIFDVSDNLL